MKKLERVGTGIFLVLAWLNTWGHYSSGNTEKAQFWLLMTIAAAATGIYWETSDRRGA
jgi:hypothetical protein